jgi:NAD+ synthase
MIKDGKFTVDSIRRELKTYLTETGLKSLVLGISGGIDSAIVAALAKPVCDELNIPLIGRYISIDSNKPEEKERADLIGNSLCTIYDSVKMDEEYSVLSLNIVLRDEVDDADITAYKIRMGNLKARLRMINLYHLASLNGGLVLSTDNRTEYLLGFWTLHGDVGDYGMIQELWKTEVYKLSRWICDNEFKIDAPHSFYDKRGVALMSCVEATATDGLGITNSDLDQILPGFVGTSESGYSEVDAILSWYHTTGEGNIKHPVLQRHIKSEFKRNNPLNLSRDKIL